MNTYIFDNNQDKTNEKIQMIFMGENTIYTEEIGNMYNLYDYFKDNNFNSDKILFCNFTGNQLEKLIIYISKYKCIDTNTVCRHGNRKTAAFCALVVAGQNGFQSAAFGIHAAVRRQDKSLLIGIVQYRSSPSVTGSPEPRTLRPAYPR